MTKGSHSQYTSFIGPAKSKKYATHPWSLCNEIIFIICLHAQADVYSDIKEKIEVQQSDHKGAITFGEL